MQQDKWHNYCNFPMFQIDHKSTMLIYFLCAIIVGANCQTETEEGNGRVG